MIRRRSLAIAALLGLWRAHPARARDTRTRWQTFPFGLKLDMAVMEDVVHSPPARLIDAIARQGVRVLRVPAAAPGLARNPLLAPLPAAPAELLKQAEFRDTYQGRVVLRGDPDCDVPVDTILIRDNAPTYTLLHEFVHTRLTPVEICPPDPGFEMRFTLALHRLDLFMRRLYDDAFRLLDPRWRRDALDALSDVAPMLFRRIQIGQSQEAIAEKVLRRLIDERSPYHDAARRDEGRRYGELMVNNAVDLFNSVHGALGFVRESVQNLREELTSGRIEPVAPEHLSEAEARQTAEAAEQVMRALAPVRREIEVLKAFYAG
jgi:hypothetical protein